MNPGLDGSECMGSRIAAIVREQAADLAHHWAREIATCLHMDLSPYPSYEDPRLILGIASYLEAADSPATAMLQLTRRAREWGYLAEVRGVGEEQILDAYLILRELLWEVMRGHASEELDPNILYRLDTALLVAMREAVGAYGMRHQERDRKTSERMGAFSRMLSHEIKGPASVISGMASLLLDPEMPQDASTREEYLQTILRNSSSIAQIVDDLLVLTMAAGQDDEPSDDACPLPEVVALVVESLASEAAKRGVRLEIGGDLPDVRVNRRATQFVLINLVSNAIRYADLTRAEPYVRIGAEPGDETDEWWMRVEDNGLGIPPDAHEKIFERLFRAHTTLPIAGTGLGLSIVRELVEGWGGRIHMASRVGEGSVFSFTLAGSRSAAEPSPGAADGSEIVLDRISAAEPAFEAGPPA
jgi:signal transduction histidine kinase